MSFKVENVIHHTDEELGYNHTEYVLNKSYRLPYFAGNINHLIPVDAKLKSKTSTKFYDIPLPNKSGLLKVNVEVGKYGLYYLQLRKGYNLSQLFVEPENINMDIYFDESRGLIYSFYNGTKADSITFTGKLVEDTNNIYLKIKNEPKNIELRRYFLYQALGKIENEEQRQKYPEIMTTEQVANYLQIAKKTIANWRSEGIIPFKKLKGAVRYKKSDIDIWIENS